MLRRYRPPPPLPPPTFPLPDGRIRAALHTPCLMRGGAERWIVDLLASVPVQWLGVGVLDPSLIHSGRRAEVEERCPVLLGSEHARLLGAAADVLLTWGLPGWWRHVPEERWPRTVLVSHGSGQWTARVFAGCERAGTLAAVSPAAADPIPEQQRGRVRVLCNGLAPERLAGAGSRSETRRLWRVPSPARVLLYVGRLSNEKNPLALVQALAHLPEEWYGVAIGDGSESLAMERLAVELQVTDRLRLPGYSDDVAGALAAADVFLLPSHEEGCSYAMLEAWAAGAPVVATPVGMVRECPDLVRGIPLGAAGEVIAAAVLAKDARGRLAAARRFVREELSLELFGRAWAALLAEVAG